MKQILRLRPGAASNRKLELVQRSGRAHVSGRRLVLGALALALPLALGFAACAESPPPSSATGEPAVIPTPRINVLLISLDTLRADHLGVYGYQRDTSPFLDQLAEDGLVFEHAFAPIHGTLPSHMSMLTGLLPWHHGVYPPAGVLPPEIPLLQEILQDVGYVTGGFTEGGYVHGGYGFARGFDVFDHDSMKLETDIERTLAKGREFLTAVAQDDAPFFLFLHTYVVHDPYFPSGSLAEQLAPRHLPPPRYNDLFGPVIPSDIPFPTGPVLSQHNAGELPMDPERIALYQAAYDRSIRYLDDQLSSFWQFLSAGGFLDDTLIVITSDHGEEFGEHGKLAHTQIYREVLQVPLIVLGPGITGARVSTPVGLVDVTPTVLEFVDLEQTLAGREIDGLPLLASPSSAVPERGSLRANRPILAEQLDERRRSAIAARSELGPVQFLQSFDRRQEWRAYSATVRSAEDQFVLEVRSYDQPRELSVTVRDGTELFRGMLPADRWSRLQLDLSSLRKPVTLDLRSTTCDPPTEFWNVGRKTCRSFQLRRNGHWSSELYRLKQDPAEVVDLSLQYPDLVDALKRELRWERRQAPRQDLDPALEERLKALGYLQ